MISEINKQVFLFLNSFAGSSEVLDAVVLFLANGAGLFLVVLTAFVISYRPFGWGILRANLLVFTPVVVAAVFAKVLKHLFVEARPFLVLDSTNLIFEHGGYDSFPSAHSTIYAALSVSAFLYSRRLGTPLFVGAFLIGISRIIVGVHWPTDIVAGFVIGALVAIVGNFFLKKILTKYKWFAEKSLLKQDSSV